MNDAESILSSTILQRRAMDILQSYEGANNFILKLKHRSEINKKFVLTRSQSEYIVNYHTRTPKIARKWVELDSYFAEKLFEDKLIAKPPTHIWVEKLLVENKIAEEDMQIFQLVDTPEEAVAICTHKAAISLKL